MSKEGSPVLDLPGVGLPDGEVAGLPDRGFVADWQLDLVSSGERPERTTIKLSPRPQSGKREPGERKIAPEEVRRFLAS